MALDLCFTLSTCYILLNSTVFSSADRPDIQYDYPTAPTGGAFEIEVRDFAVTNQTKFGRVWGVVIPTFYGGKKIFGGKRGWRSSSR